MRFETSPVLDLQLVTNEIVAIEANMKSGCGIQRERLIELLERRAELQRELESRRNFFMAFEIDALASAIIDGLQIPDTTEVPHDVFAKFQSDAELASEIGWRATDRFIAETSVIERRASEIFKRERTTPATATAPANFAKGEDWDERLTLSDDSRILQKWNPPVTGKNEI